MEHIVDPNWIGPIDIQVEDKFVWTDWTLKKEALFRTKYNCTSVFRTAPVVGNIALRDSRSVPQLPCLITSSWQLWLVKTPWRSLGGQWTKSSTFSTCASRGVYSGVKGIWSSVAREAAMTLPSAPETIGEMTRLWNLIAMRVAEERVCRVTATSNHSSTCRLRVLAGRSHDLKSLRCFSFGGRRVHLTCMNSGAVEAAGAVSWAPQKCGAPVRVWLPVTSTSCQFASADPPIHLGNLFKWQSQGNILLGLLVLTTINR